jgi:hypothetical protein
MELWAPNCQKVENPTDSAPMNVVAQRQEHIPTYVLSSAEIASLLRVPLPSRSTDIESQHREIYVLSKSSASMMMSCSLAIPLNKKFGIVSSWKKLCHGQYFQSFHKTEP